MIPLSSRRGFLAAGAAACSLPLLTRPGLAQPAGLQPLRLVAETRILEVRGRAARVFGLQGPAGPGLALDPGQTFRVDLANRLDQATLIHWHGQIPPHAQDGVPDMPLPALQPGETRAYDFVPRPGTHWMHAHIPVQEMNLLAAPLIVRRPGDLTEDRQEVVLMLHDFAFQTPETVLAQITAGAGVMEHGMAHAAAAGQGMGMDFNDHDWDAYLANDRTLDDPQVVTVDKRGRVRLRVINAAAATVFWIDTGGLTADLLAVDGNDVAPRSGTRFGIAMGQRLDLALELPGTGSWPILARREGAREQTGLILATPGAQLAKVAAIADQPAPAFDLGQEAGLVARDPLPDRPMDRGHVLTLGGKMQPYQWTINGAAWGQHSPLAARSGERVVLAFHNMSSMAHPMHLHGHSFQVVEVNGRRLAGARRDTLHVPPMSMVSVALDAGEAADWMLHCHHMPHLATGMMTELAITA